MNATTIASLLLGGGGALTGFYAIYTQIRDRGRSVRKQESDLRLDEATERRIITEAAKIGSDERIEAERWWSQQIDDLRADLREESTLARDARREVNRLVAWADSHQEWDRRAWRKAMETDPQFPPPPQLEHGAPLPGNGTH